MEGMVRHDTMIDEVMQTLGFVRDLGPSWVLDRPDGTSVLLYGLDERGEPDTPVDDAPVAATVLRDPWDHATVIAEHGPAELAIVLAWIFGWLCRTEGSGGGD